MLHAILFLLSYMQILRIFPMVTCALIASPTINALIASPTIIYI
jgi:hypothetical protein